MNKIFLAISKDCPGINKIIGDANEIPMHLDDWNVYVMTGLEKVTDARLYIKTVTQEECEDDECPESPKSNNERWR